MDYIAFLIANAFHIYIIYYFRQEIYISFSKNILKQIDFRF